MYLKSVGEQILYQWIRSPRRGWTSTARGMIKNHPPER